MNQKFIIKGGKPLKGTIQVRGSKNAALPILAASLLTHQPCVIANLPLIEDVKVMIKLLESLGAKVKWLSQRKVQIQAADIDPQGLNDDLVCQLRASLLLIGPLVAQVKKLAIPFPGGCKIGSRPLDTHLRAFENLGVKYKIKKGEKRGKFKPRDYYIFKKANLTPQTIVLNEFSVTATENILLCAATLEGETTIKIAASEPHVQDLCKFLQKMGAKIQGIGTHTLKIKGKKNLHGATHKITSDYLEAGTFAIMGAATRSRIKIKNACLNHLDLPLKKLKEMGANITFKKSNKEAEDVIIVQPASKLKATKIEARPYPGIPTDLQAPFGVLATQAEGTSIIHDTLFEGRLKYIEELKKMGASAIIADPHRALITGPTPLFGREIQSYDIRAGATLVIAALVAEGKTIINDIYQIDRGYESIEERLKEIGADIERRG